MRTLLESALAPGGQLVLSCEAVIESGPDLALRPSGCCARKHSHVQALGLAAGFDKRKLKAPCCARKTMHRYTVLWLGHTNLPGVN